MTNTETSVPKPEGKHFSILDWAKRTRSLPEGEEEARLEYWLNRRGVSVFTDPLAPDRVTLSAGNLATTIVFVFVSEEVSSGRMELDAGEDYAILLDSLRLGTREKTEELVRIKADRHLRRHLKEEASEALAHPIHWRVPGPDTKVLKERFEAISYGNWKLREDGRIVTTSYATGEETGTLLGPLFKENAAFISHLKNDFEDLLDGYGYAYDDETELVRLANEDLKAEKAALVSKLEVTEAHHEADRAAHEEVLRARDEKIEELEKTVRELKPATPEYKLTRTNVADYLILGERDGMLIDLVMDLIEGNHPYNHGNTDRR